MKTIRKLTLIALILTAPLVFLNSGAAQETDTDTADSDEYVLEEVITTARRRVENLQDTPLSVTSFSESALQDRSIRNTRDITQFTPNVLLIDNEFAGSGSGAAYIRGIGQTDFVITADPGVGMYVDGIYMARTMGSLQSLLDVERIEILRGPQGTLFGKNTIGGAIQIITNRPHEEFAGRVELTYGSFARSEIKADVNVPVTDSLFVKIAGASIESDGYGRTLDRTFVQGGRQDGIQRGDEDVQVGRLQALWRPTDSFEANLSIDASRRRGHQSPGSLLSVNPDAALPGIIRTPGGATTFREAYEELNASDPLLGLIFDESVVTGEDFVSTATGPQQQNFDIWGTSLTLDWELNGFDVKSITAYREMEVDLGVDNDESSVDLFEQEELNELDQFTQEFQISSSSFDARLNWLMGLYYFKETGSRFILGHQFGDFWRAGYIPVFIETGVANTIDIETKNWAIFGQGTFAFTDKFSATFGLRYSDEEKTTAGERRGFFTRKFVASGIATDSWSSWSPRLGLEYRWNDELMTYISAAKGFKSGGFNARLNAATPNAGILSYDPEFVWTFELGFKSDLLDSRLRLNGAVFFSDYTDMQILSQEFVNAILVTQLNNVGESEIKGFELEAVGVLATGLIWNLGIGYTNAQYTDVGSAAAVGLTTDSIFPRTPEWTVSAGTQYNQDISPGTMIYRIDYSWRDETQAIDKPQPLIDADAFGLLNLRVAYEHGNGGWSLAAFVTNATDERYITGGRTDRPWFNRVAYGRPREWGITVNFNF